MALRRPPTHRIDATIVYVDGYDEAWKHEQIAKEMEDLQKDGKGYVDHPYGRYAIGLTRYDLDATHELFGVTKCAREYLDDSKAPIYWELRRLSWEQWAECQQLIRSGRELAAKLLAARYGLKKATVAGNWLTIDNRAQWLSDKDMGTLWEMDHELPERIGAAVLFASRELTDDEKKA